MAERRTRTPRSYFGLSPAPQPGLQEPALSPSMSQRFSDAGLSDFTPYINPWETVARARDYRAVESDLAVQDAEDRFIQRIQRDPSSATTGLQKFLAEDPRLIASPMFRAYAVTQDRLAQKPKTDPYALDAAESGKEFLDAYNKDIASGVPQLDAFAAHRSRIAEAKKKAPEDERLTLSGTPKEEFDTAVSEYLQAQDYEPTEDEKRAFLPAGKKDLTEKDWSDAWYKAREQRQSEALKKLDRIRKVYGGFYKMPQGMNQAPVVAGPPVGPEQIAAANQTAPAVSETVTATPAGVTETVAAQAPPTTAKQTIPSYTHRLERTPLDAIMQNAEQAAPVLSNLATNLTTDPLGKLGDVVMGRGTEVIGEATLPQTQQRDNSKWSTAKSSMLSYLNSLGKSPEEVEEMLGSILRGDRLPIDIFLKEGATKEDQGRLPAHISLGQAFRRANKTAHGSALTDSSGTHGWEDVARALAQEYFTQKGIIAPTNESGAGAPVTAPSTRPDRSYLWNGTKAPATK